jgi:hypothetical protein
VTSKFLVRCRNCGRIVLNGVQRIADRESDALASHLRKCRPDLIAPGDDRWRSELGPLLAQFDVRDDG